MTMTDPIADLLTRIRNACGAKHATCELGASKMKEQLARIFREQGYIADYSVGVSRAATAAHAATRAVVHREHTRARRQLERIATRRANVNPARGGDCVAL